MLDALVREERWLFASLLLALAFVTVFRTTLWRSLPDDPGEKNARALELAYGVMIGSMGSGHLLAVVIVLARGTLDGSPLLLLSLGAALAVPGWWLVSCTLRRQPRSGGTSIALQAWLAVLLLAMGPHNLPLAAPAGLSIAYRASHRRAAKTALLVGTVLLYGALFVGATVFLLSGQSFEQFRSTG